MTIDYKTIIINSTILTDVVSYNQAFFDNYVLSSNQNGSLNVTIELDNEFFEAYGNLGLKVYLKDDIAGNTMGELGWFFGYDFGNPLTNQTANGIKMYYGNDISQSFYGSNLGGGYARTGFQDQSTGQYWRMEFNGVDATGSNYQNIQGPPICFAAGAEITLADGSRRLVEALSVGDMIMTKDHGARPIKWIGSTRRTAETLNQFKKYRPILIRAGALGNDRDLRVSPQHRMLISGATAAALSASGAEEVLIPAKALINDHSILIDHSCEEVEYFHILFDDHEIIEANGCWSESFKPGQYAMSTLAPDTYGEVVALFPELEEGADESLAPAREMIRPGQVRRLGGAA